MNALFHKYVSLVLTMLVFSCGTDEAEDATRYTALSPFDEIQVNGVFHIFLGQDTVFSISISGNKDIIEGVKYTIENRILSLTNETKMMWLKPADNDVEVLINADRLKKVVANEASLIETVNPIITDEFGLITGKKYCEANLELNNNIFYFWNNFPCGGKITLTGNTRSLRIWNFVIMAVDASSLAADHALIENHSVGDCKVLVKDMLEYSIYGKGNIYLYGNPNQIILKEKTSSGELIRVE